MGMLNTVDEISSSRSLRRKLSKFIKLHHDEIYSNKTQRLAIESYAYLLKMTLINSGRTSLHIALDTLDAQLGPAPTMLDDFAHTLLWNTNFRVSNGRLVPGRPHIAGYRPRLKEVGSSVEIAVNRL